MDFVKSLVGGKSRKEEAIKRKEEGNAWFKKKEYAKALDCYTNGIDLFPLDERSMPAVVIDTSTSG